MKKLILFIFAGIFLFLKGEVFAQPSSALVAEAESGYLLLKDNVREELPPASLTKVMTLYLTFGALEKGWLKWDDKLPVSLYAASQPRTNLNLQPGQTLTVREAVLSLIVHSANDAAVVLAEAMASDEGRFADMMTQTAGFLNMGHTVFKNASGLHEEGQKTTAQDMAILTLAMIKHYPQYYPLFSTSTFDFRGKTYETHNHVLKEYQGAEGLKTGYVSAGGYNIISTAKKNDIRLVGVVMGKETSKERDSVIRSLLDSGFERAFRQKQAVSSGHLSPAFDPLHRRIFLKKVDLDLFAASIKYQIAQSKKTAELLLKQNQLQPQQNLLPIDFPPWSIQVGAFSSLKKAQKMANYAFALLGEKSLKTLTYEKNSVFKAQLTGFSDKQCALNACKKLKNQECPCFLVMPLQAQGDE